MKHLRLIPVALLFLAGIATAQTVVTRMDWPRAYGGAYEVYWQAVPTSLTAIDTKDSRLIGWCVSNTTGSGIVFTMQTKDASPLALPLNGTIAANTSTCNNTPFGLLSKGGFSVQAGGAGLLFGAVWTH